MAYAVYSCSILLIMGYVKSFLLRSNKNSRRETKAIFYKGVVLLQYKFIYGIFMTNMMKKTK